MNDEYDGIISEEWRGGTAVLEMPVYLAIVFNSPFQKQDHIFSTIQHRSQSVWGLNEKSDMA